MVKNQPIRRTRTIQQTIEQSKNITKDHLGRTRSQTNPKKIANKKQIRQKVKTQKIQPKKKAVQLKKKVNKVVARDTAQIKQVKGNLLVNQNEIKQDQNAPRRTDSRATAGIVDVVFCCDTTSSMSSLLNQTKQTIRDIVRNIKNKSQSEEISVRFGFVGYRDHPPQDDTYVTIVFDLCTDEEIINHIENQSACGGGDYPEAALDGLLAAAKQINWRDSKSTPSLRYIFHIADAPPHGEEFGYPSQWSKGVPSGVTLAQVIHAINIREIHYRLINLNENGLKKMATLFKTHFTNYDETQLQNAKDLNIRVSDMIIHELLPDMDYND